MAGRHDINATFPASRLIRKTCQSSGEPTTNSRPRATKIPTAPWERPFAGGLATPALFTAEKHPADCDAKRQQSTGSCKAANGEDVNPETLLLTNNKAIHLQFFEEFYAVGGFLAGHIEAVPARELIEKFCTIGSFFAGHVITMAQLLDQVLVSCQNLWLLSSSIPVP